MRDQAPMHAPDRSTTTGQQHKAGTVGVRSLQQHTAVQRCESLRLWQIGAPRCAFA